MRIIPYILMNKNAMILYVYSVLHSCVYPLSVI